jgi:phosphogluconate dehydratase
LHGGPIARVADGDQVRIDAVAGAIEVLTPGALERSVVPAPAPATGLGRELFSLFQGSSDDAERGASPVLAAMDARG